MTAETEPCKDRTLRRYMHMNSRNTVQWAERTFYQFVIRLDSRTDFDGRLIRMDVCVRKRNSRTPCLIRAGVMIFAAVFCLASTTNASKGNEMATLTEWGDNTSYRQDFCSRYQEMAKKQGGNFSMKDALSGSELRVHFGTGVLDNYYIRYNESTGIDPEYPGFNAVILDKMAEKGNFTWRNSFAVTRYDPRVHGNTTITDGLEWGVNKYDLMVGAYASTSERMSRGIGFVEGIHDGSLIMTRIKEIEEAPIDWFAYLRPFEPRVWYTIVVVVVFSSICHRFIEVLGGKYEAGTSIRSWGMENLYLSILSSTGHYSYEPKTLGGRVFGIVFAFWALLLTAAYTANLASYYVLKQVAEPPVLDLQDAIDKGFSICIERGTHVEAYLRRYYPDASPNLVSNGLFDWVGPLQRGDCEISITPNYEFETLRYNKEANPSCSLDLQGQMIHQTSMGFATKLDLGSSCPDVVNSVLSYYVIELKEEGFLEEAWKKHIEFFGTKGHCEEDEGIRRHLETSERKPRNHNRGHNRRLKSSTKGSESQAGAAGGAATEARMGAATKETEKDRSMTLKEMAGTMVLQVVGALFAILLALLGRYEGNASGRTSRKREQTMATTPPSQSDISTESKLTELTQTIRSMQESFCELRRDLEQRDPSFHTGSLVNRRTYAVPTGRSVPPSNRENGESGLRASWAVDSSTSIVFDSGDTDDYNTTTVGLGTFHSHLSSQCPQAEGKEGT